MATRAPTSFAKRYRAALCGAWVLLVTGVGAYAYARVVDAVYPIDQWLFWSLARLWGWVLLFNLACVSFGQLALVRILRMHRLQPLESAVLSMAVGVVCFELVMYAGGALAWFTPTFAIALPSIFLVAGARDGIRLARRLVASARDAPPPGPLIYLITAAGAICVFIIYLGAMTPDALNYDSTWCHLTIAQDYARAGRIIPFPGDYTKNVPQLASIVHTWGWLLPGLNPPLRWMLALHQEFGLFLWTLAGVAAAVRRLVHSPRLKGAWVAFFLFPIIFVYDNNLGGAADHVCAFFAPALLLATLHVCATFSPSSSALLGITAAGALATKYQAAYEIASTAAVLALVWGIHLMRHVRRRANVATPSLRRLLWSPLIVAAVGAICVCPHFVRQTIFHHNPVYPFLQDVIKQSTPTLPNAAFYFRQTFSDPHWWPHGTLWHKFVHACELFVTFSFDPHYSFTKNWPVFGSLFTLLLPALLVVGNLRLAVATFIGSGALLIWGMTYNVDRNLQIFMPLFVCVAAAIIVRLWRLHWIARVGLIPLIALQVVWGSDALFYNSYERVGSAINLIRSGFEGRAYSRLNGYRSEYLAIGHSLPKNARLLLHTTHVSLGIDRDIVLDWIGYQALISYHGLHTPRELFDYYRARGITHLLYEPGRRPAGTKQEEVLWSAFIKRYAKQIGSFAHYRLLQMPTERPPAEPSYRVATFGLNGYGDGIYPIAALHVDEYLLVALKKYPPPQTAISADASESTLRQELSEVDAIIVAGWSAHSKLAKAVKPEFNRGLPLADGSVLYLRKQLR